MPHFSLPDQNGKIHNFSDYKGSWLVIYIYPKDNSPACTKVACSLRDNLEELSKTGITVLGVSKDSIRSHKNFESKQSLNFPILSDPEGKLIEGLGAWGPKFLFGRTFLAVHRNIYIANPQGEIVKEYRDLPLLSSVDQVISDLKSFTQF